MARQKGARLALMYAPVMIFVMLALIYIGREDKIARQGDNAHWCDMVASGHWFADQAERESRCGGDL
ncbi:MAG: hypothetical protein COA78_06895 [Blastopirellula sp.]|nr:MAG: hypothetical protein COA78_06895 [Blastopirellula sp.]